MTRYGWMAAALVAAVSAAQAITVGHVDGFQDGTTLSWISGASPTHRANGGPAGVGDGYLEISRTDSPFHLGAKNGAQWSGDYLSAGVTSIDMDIKRFDGPDAVNMRILVFGPGGVWASSGLTPVADDWARYAFGVTPADLIYVAGSGGTAVLSDTLSAVSTLLIRHDSPVPPAPSGHPPHILAVVGLDNIAALPEPATAMLLAAGLLACRRRRWRTRPLP